jgi:hypothetical protein
MTHRAPVWRRALLVALPAAAIASMACNGLVDTLPVSAEDDARDVDDAAATSEPRSDVADVYGALFEGDGDMCGAVICSGSQVCCVVSVPSEAATPNPNNKCDYHCTAVCMDSCPAVALTTDDAASAPLHGGGIVEPSH